MKALLLSAVLACVPAGAADIAAPRVDFSSFTLSNGLRVVLSRDASVPVVAMTMIVDVGGRHETPGRSGFAHLFEHMMFEGSRHVPKGGFDKLLESYGGDNNASTHEDFTFYYEEVPSNALPIALWLDADRVGALSVTPESVKNQIEVVKEEKRMRVDNEPYGSLLYVEMASHTFSNWQNSHPTIGSFEDLDAASLKDVRAFFEAYYSPDNIIMAIVGDIKLDETRALVSSYFGSMPVKPRPKAADTTEPAPAGERTIRLVDAHAKLPALGFTWKGGPDRGTQDYYALLLLGKALFSGKSARLYQKLVKESQVAVSLDGGLGFPISDADEYTAPGAFGGFVVHKREKTSAELKALVEAEIAKVAKDGLTDAELERVKTKFRSDWLRGQETRLGRAQRLLYAALLDGDPEAANRELSRFMAVTPDQIRRAAAARLSPAASTWFELAAGEAK
ncbi:MAG: pitrilysin family protein [Elusimicrobia bacterium]|nr:pitrilysin family protein [Elusimicrobiota bacterium]